MIYLDSSSLFKLVKREAESAQLQQFLEGQEVISCELVLTELNRSALREASRHRLANPQVLLDMVAAVCSGIGLVPLDRETLISAGTLRPFQLRSLDAIHVASALRGEADVFVSYDLRQSDAARAAGLKVSAPGS